MIRHRKIPISSLNPTCSSICFYMKKQTKYYGASLISKRKKNYGASGPNCTEALDIPCSCTVRQPS